MSPADSLRPQGINRLRTATSTAGLLTLAAVLLHGCASLQGTVDTAQNDGIALSAGEQSAIDALVQETLETRISGESAIWQGTSRMISAVVTPIRTFQTADTFCREYEVAVSLGSADDATRSTACRNENGVWLGYPG